MFIRKHTKADLRRDYALLIELGMIAALAVLIVAFRIEWTNDSTLNVVQPEQERVTLEEIRQTHQMNQPPPPPRPPVPIEVPNEEVLEDENLDLDASLDLDEPLAEIAPPTAPPEEDVEEETEAEIFIVVEEMPELIGGIAALQKSISYPEIAKKAGVEGRVIVQFIVDEQGGVIDPVVVRGIGAGCDDEALRAVKLAHFKPGKQRGKAVRVRMSLPVTFRLS
jgi:protein TonB